MKRGRSRGLSGFVCEILKITAREKSWDVTPPPLYEEMPAFLPCKERGGFVRL